MDKKLSLDYIAGFVDGEGCISIIKHNAKPDKHTKNGWLLVPWITIVQKDITILEMIRDVLNENGLGCNIRITNKGIGHLKLSGYKRCLAFCKLMKNKLFVKRDQLELLQEFIERRLSFKMGTPYDETDLDYHKKLQDLKK